VEGKAMMIMYRGYTLVPLKEETKSRVKVFSGATFITATQDYIDEEASLCEAKKMVDSILNSWEGSPGFAAGPSTFRGLRQ
jgi:hypothetical protein